MRDAAGGCAKALRWALTRADPQLGIIGGCIAAIPLIVIKMRQNHYELHYICAPPGCRARAALPRTGGQKCQPALKGVSCVALVDTLTRTGAP